MVLESICLRMALPTQVSGSMMHTSAQMRDLSGWFICINYTQSDFVSQSIVIYDAEYDSTHDKDNEAGLRLHEKTQRHRTTERKSAR